MKKTYNIPNIEVVKIQTIGMLADSLTKGATTVTTEEKVLSREMDFFDEE